MDLLSHGNAVAGTFRQIAMSFGAAVSTSVYTLVANSLPGGITNPTAGIGGINASFAYQSVLCAIGLIICIFFVRDKKMKRRRGRLGKKDNKK